MLDGAPLPESGAPVILPSPPKTATVNHQSQSRLGLRLQSREWSNRLPSLRWGRASDATVCAAARTRKNEAVEAIACVGFVELFDSFV